MGSFDFLSIVCKVGMNLNLDYDKQRGWGAYDMPRATVTRRIATGYSDK